MDEQELLAYVERQALMLWGHYQMDLRVARLSIQCNLMRGVAPTDDLWQQCGKSIEEMRLAFDYPPRAVPKE